MNLATTASFLPQFSPAKRLVQPRAAFEDFSSTTQAEFDPLAEESEQVQSVSTDAFTPAVIKHRKHKLKASPVHTVQSSSVSEFSVGAGALMGALIGGVASFLAMPETKKMVEDKRILTESAWHNDFDDSHLGSDRYWTELDVLPNSNDPKRLASLRHRFQQWLDNSNSKQCYVSDCQSNIIYKLRKTTDKTAPLRVEHLEHPVTVKLQDGTPLLFRKVMDASSNAMRIETVKSHQHESPFDDKFLTQDSNTLLLPWLYSNFTVKKEGDKLAFQVDNSLSTPEQFRCQFTVAIDKATKTFQPNTVVWDKAPATYTDADKQEIAQIMMVHLEKTYKDNLPAFMAELNKPISGMSESGLLGLLQDHEPLLKEVKSKNFFAIGMLTMGFAGVGAIVGAMCFPKKMEVG